MNKVTFTTDINIVSLAQLELDLLKQVVNPKNENASTPQS